MRRHDGGIAAAFGLTVDLAKYNALLHPDILKRASYGGAATRGHRNAGKIRILEFGELGDRLKEDRHCAKSIDFLLNEYLEKAPGLKRCQEMQGTAQNRIMRELNESG